MEICRTGFHQQCKEKEGEENGERRERESTVVEYMHNIIFYGICQ